MATDILLAVAAGVFAFAFGALCAWIVRRRRRLREVWETMDGLVDENILDDYLEDVPLRDVQMGHATPDCRLHAVFGKLLAGRPPVVALHSPGAGWGFRVVGSTESDAREALASYGPRGCVVEVVFAPGVRFTFRPGDEEETTPKDSGTPQKTGTAATQPVWTTGQPEDDEKELDDLFARTAGPADAFDL